MHRGGRLLALIAGAVCSFAAIRASHADAIYPVSYTTVGDHYAWDAVSSGEPGFGFIASGAANTLDLSSQVQGGTWPGAPGPGGTWSDLPAPDWTKPVSSPVYDYEYYQVTHSENAPYIGWEGLNPDLSRPRRLYPRA